MKRPFFLFIFYLGFSLIFNSCEKPKKRPNFILIMTDDQGWFDVGFNGNTEILTPRLDQLAAQGIIFDRFYSASAECSPTRASCLTGRNPLRMEIPLANSGHLKNEEITIPEVLKKQGYATAHFGKWHLGTLSKTVPDANRGGRKKFEKEYSLPTEHGYDQFFCTESKVPTYDPMIYPDSFALGESKRYGWRAMEMNQVSKPYGTAYWFGENQKEESNLNGDNSRVIMDRVIPFINSSIESDQPFFTTLWFHTPHLPVVSDSLYRSKYPDMSLDKRLYYGTITAMDDQVGRLWDHLEKLGIEEDTVIFFCSDNGPENRTPGNAGTFRARKRSLYEGGVRVPAFVIWKNGLDKNRRVDFPAVTSDYLPTILDILNIDPPATRPLDGLSLLPALTNKASKRQKGIGFIRQPQISWVTDQFKLIQPEKEAPYELYDLLEDRSEKENIIEQHPEKAEELKAELEVWLNSVKQSAKGFDYD